MPLSSQDIAQQIIHRFDAAKSTRGTLESHWEEIALRILPNYARTFTTPQINRIEGEKKTEEMVDATGALALIRFAAVMESMLTPRNSQWHGLEASDPALMRDRSVRLWFEEATRLLFKYRYAPDANFASEKNSDYMSLGAFGTGCLFIDTLKGIPGIPRRGLRYRAIHLGEIIFFENEQGIIDTAMRYFSLTARQAILQFGADNLPKDIATHAESATQSEKLYEFIHCVKPRMEAEGYDARRVDVKGLPYVSYYVCKHSRDLCEEGGYYSFPYSISRYVTAPREIYGRSPAMLGLPALKTLNEEKKTVLKQGHRTVDPVLLAHDDGVIDTFSLRPGALNAGGVTADGKLLIHTLPTGNLALAQEMMQDERQVINDLFLVTLFQILVETPTMTATEVLERVREKGMLLSPTMGRQQSEALGPQITRELDVLAQQRLLSPMPPLLREARGEYQPVYTSPLSRAQKAEEVTGLFRTVDWMREVIAVTQDPTPLDHIDWDKAVPDILTAQAVPERWRRSMKMVLATRQQRAQAQQSQQMVDAAPAMASVVKTGADMMK